MHQPAIIATLDMNDGTGWVAAWERCTGQDIHSFGYVQKRSSAYMEKQAHVEKAYFSCKMEGKCHQRV